MHQVLLIPGVDISLTKGEQPAFVLTYGTLTMKFKAYDVGLFYCDVNDGSSFYYGSLESAPDVPTSTPDSPKTKTTVTNYTSSYVQTVSSNKSLYTVQEIEGADKALALQQYIG